MKRLKPPTFFIDRSLGRHTIADSLRQAGAHVEIHDDHFAEDARDEVWLREVGKRGWIVLTKDKRFKHRVVEVTAITRARVKVFKLTAGNLQASEMADVFLAALSRISRVAMGNAAPFIATVSKAGRVSVVLSKTKLRRYA